MIIAVPPLYETPGFSFPIRICIESEEGQHLVKCPGLAEIVEPDFAGSEGSSYVIVCSVLGIIFRQNDFPHSISRRQVLGFSEIRGVELHPNGA